MATTKSDKLTICCKIWMISQVFWGEKNLRYVGYQRFCRAFIHEILADSSKGVVPVICLQYRQKSKAQDICFLLLISAIKAHLRFVGDTTSFRLSVRIFFFV